MSGSHTNSSMLQVSLALVFEIVVVNSLPFVVKLTLILDFLIVDSTRPFSLTNQYVFQVWHNLYCH